MARAITEDFLQNFRFQVEMANQAGSFNYFTGDSASNADRPGGVAGFQSCTLPEISSEATEYREGTFKYTRKFNGVASVTDVSLMRGLALNDSALFSWMMDAIGGGESRADIAIKQFSRGALTVLENGVSVPGEGDYAEADGAQTRIYTCFNAIPIRYKPGADLDATSSEVSVQELDLAIEFFTISVGT